MDCVFCSIPKPLLKSVLWDVGSFLIIYDGFPIAEPHFLVIPKTHLLSYSLLKPEQWPEFEGILTKIRSMLSDTPLFVFEHGKVGQTVKHAHMHIIPQQYTAQEVISAMDLPGKTKTIEHIADLSNLSSYLYFQDAEQNNTVFLPDDSTTVEPGIITNTIARLLGMPYPASKRIHPSKKTVNQYKQLFLQ